MCRCTVVTGGLGGTSITTAVTRHWRGIAVPPLATDTEIQIFSYYNNKENGEIHWMNLAPSMFFSLSTCRSCFCRSCCCRCCRLRNSKYPVTGGKSMPGNQWLFDAKIVCASVSICVCVSVGMLCVCVNNLESRRQAKRAERGRQ